MNVENKKSVSSGITILSQFMGIISGVILLLNAISERIEYIQEPIVAKLCGCILIIAMVMAAYIIIFKEQKKKSLRFLTLAVLVLGSLFLGVQVDLYLGQTSVCQNIPLQVAYNDDFEDIKDPTYVAPWEAYPTPNPPTLLVSSDRTFAHSGDHSLRLSVDLPPFATNMSTNYCGIGITRKFREVKAVIAWVLVPKSEQVRDSTFSSHIMAYMHDKDADETIGFHSETIKLMPGVGTPIFLGTPYYSTDSKNCDFSVDGTINELYLTVWSEKHYTGSIYVDDITIYTAAAGAK
jgi:hypothetical protein